MLIRGNLGLFSEKQVVWQFRGSPGQQASENSHETSNQAFLPKTLLFPSSLTLLGITKTRQGVAASAHHTSTLFPVAFFSQEKPDLH